MDKEFVFYSVSEFQEFLKTIGEDVSIQITVEFEGGEDLAKEEQ